MAEEPDDAVEYWSARARPAWQIVTVAVVGAAVVLAIHFGPVRSRIENRLTSASEQALGTVGLQAVAVSFSGRDAGLRGDPAAVAAAVPVVEAVQGVRVARPRSDPATAAGTDTAAAGDATATATATATETETEIITVPAGLAEQLAALDAIRFDQDSATLSDDADDVIAEAAQLILASDDGSRFVVAAHTDTVGSLQQNVVISQLRADAVAAELIEAGVDPDRLDAVGYGEQRPAVAPELTAADREANRRVEILPLP